MRRRGSAGAWHDAAKRHRYLPPQKVVQKSPGCFCRSARPSTRFLLLRLEEEGRLNDMPLRENFIERVFVFYCCVQLSDDNPTPGGLIQV
jgi:hypothetical protein